MMRPTTQAERQYEVDNLIADARLEGHELEPEFLALYARYVQGEVSHAELTTLWDAQLKAMLEGCPRYGEQPGATAACQKQAIGALSEAEQEAFLDRLGERLLTPTPEELAYWTARDAAGLGVGMDEHGALVYPANSRHIKPHE